MLAMGNGKEKVKSLPNNKICAPKMAIFSNDSLIELQNEINKFLSTQDNIKDFKVTESQVSTTERRSYYVMRTVYILYSEWVDNQ